MTEPDRLDIRPATVDERRAVVDLWIKTGLTTAHNDPIADFDFAHDRPSSTVLVGLAGGEVVASVMVGHDGHRGWLYYVSVDPRFQKSDHGAAIASAGEGRLKQRGVRKVLLLIRDTNTAVESFYRRIGYETIPRIIMQKWLEPQ